MLLPAPRIAQRLMRVNGKRVSSVTGGRDRQTMQLTVMRFFQSQTCTIGIMYVDGVFQCFTLELPKTFEDKENVPDKTCIPCGTFPVQMAFSEKHHARLPHVLNVPGRSAIEIHAANWPTDLLGCMGVAEGASPLISYVGPSDSALHALLNKVPQSDPFSITVSEITGAVAQISAAAAKPMSCG